ncbi:hypothetical protein SSP1443 [Staphylococcus saprophyticus subsp. saprophyticus ATCC 15305]|uniref:Uncharacterized protein n=1 Tax=Staphylococcus saprophyticus subsp. saprophyticus (strain ATCC 15305 / DSM 20229 / NCIMB 8711 / NCTC 7292 / S-41) TaxID=342451 RepID=Q49XB0_STAS1|nr:hypothetical protein SSP1443 [Staphylococcus saprophyticus subsp. saprophyticus ATCC 15305] [Staphylococcus saprophyticus subsp. saprophyticus ATCC 15305 = NCTC 7292]
MSQTLQTLAKASVFVGSFLCTLSVDTALACSLRPVLFHRSRPKLLPIRYEKYNIIKPRH